MGKKQLIDIIDGLAQRKRSFDVLRLLVEDGDNEMALVVAHKLNADLEEIITELELTLGREPAARPSSRAQADVPRAAATPSSAPARGYLGDDDRPGRLEQWVETLVRGLWGAISHPQKTFHRLAAHRGKVVFALALVLLLFTADRAYERIFLGGYGLTGEYYLDTELKTLYAKRLDHTVNFRWLRRPPMPGFRAEQFSIRWTGYVKIDEPDLYEFYTISDDGVRLWVDDQQIIDDWQIHSGFLDKGELRLTAGYHKIRLEYYQGNGDMVMKLHWKRPADSQKKVIPARHLFPEIPKE